MSAGSAGVTYRYEGALSQASAVSQAFLSFGISHAGKEKETILFRAAEDGALLFTAGGGFVRRGTAATRDELVHFLLAALCELTGKPLGPWGELLGMRPTKALYRFLREDDWEEKARAYLRKKQVSPSIEALLLETAAHQVESARDDAANQVSLYTHIPFCPSRCAYCSFPSAIVPTGGVPESYAAALSEDIRRAAALIRDAGLVVTSRYMGGGTPTALSPHQMRRVLSEIKAAGGASAEWTVEAGRPDTLTEEMAAVLQEAGVTRISVNPQTMQDRILETVSRAHTRQDIEAAMARARRFRFPSVNMDFICGLPGQRVADAAENAEAICQWRPENVTIHTLAVKRGSAFFGREREWNLPPAAEVAEMLALLEETLRAAGYRPYYLYRQKYMTEDFANVGYALPGQDSLYNIEIMNEHRHVLGTGAGAASKYVVDDHRLRKLYFPKAPEVYRGRLSALLEARRKLFEGEGS